MQILDYDNKENIHVCLSCDTEFAVTITNSEDDELNVEFCPCCGSPLEEDEDEEGYIDEDDPELY